MCRSEAYFGEALINIHSEHEYTNAISSFFFLIPTIYNYNYDLFSTIWCTTTFCLCIGSVLNHYYRKNIITKLSDTMTMVLCIEQLIIVCNLNNYLLISLTIILSVITICLSIHEKESIEILYLYNYAFLIIILIYSINTRSNEFYLAIIYLTCGLICWYIDLKFYCSLSNYSIIYNNYIYYLNFHILWHLFASLSLYNCYLCISI